MAGMEPVAIATMLILVQYFVFVLLVGRARIKSGVAAPAVTGDPVFERSLRVQQNTLEQLIIVLPALWLFAFYVSATVAAVTALVFIAGRWLYCHDYVRDPAKRGRGFILGQLAQLVLVLGAIGGPVISWIGQG